MATFFLWRSQKKSPAQYLILNFQYFLSTFLYKNLNYLGAILYFDYDFGHNKIIGYLHHWMITHGPTGYALPNIIPTY